MAHRFQLYKYLEQKQSEILRRIQSIPEEIGVPTALRGQLGLLGGSDLHAPPREEVLQAIHSGSRKLTSAQALNARLRTLIKDHYGDEWDAIAVSTGEAALELVIDTLMSPSLAGRGESIATRYIAPFERHIHHHAGYGMPFPPRYKDVTAERGVTSGEFGMIAKRIWNLSTVFVRLAGARYEAHGIRQFTCPLLETVDADDSAAALRRAAETHAPWLSGFASMGYDTPGYGYGEQEDGAPRLQKHMGSIAREFGVPYLVDNARGTPFLGNDPRTIYADVMIYSTDKAFNGPTGGLIIGREEYMVQVRRAMGMHGSRRGTVESHGKAGYVGFDPGKEALLGIISSLESLQEDPDSYTKPVDRFYEIAVDEISTALPSLRDQIVITKSRNQLAVEIAYGGTWGGSTPGIPIFSIEDMYAGTNLVQSALPAMGMLPGMLGYDANIIIAPGMGTTDEHGALIDENAVAAIRCLARSLAVIYEYALDFDRVAVT